MKHSLTLAAALFASLSSHFASASPQVTALNMVQDGGRKVTITYTITNAPAVVKRLIPYGCTNLRIAETCRI